MYFFSGTLLAKGHAFSYLSRAEPSLLCPCLHLKGTFLHRDSSVSLLHSAAARNPSFRGLLSAFLTGWCVFGHVVVSTQAYRCHTGWGLFFLYFFSAIELKKKKKKIGIRVSSQAYSGIFKREVAKQIQTAFCELRINHSLIYLSLLFWSVSSSKAVHFKKKKDEEPQWREVASLYNRLCHFKNVSVWPWMHPACIMHTFFLKVLNESEVMKENICNLIGWKFQRSIIRIKQCERRSFPCCDSHQASCVACGGGLYL